MDQKIVYVSDQPSEGAEPALATPVFIVEHDGKLYVTRAVWEYHEGEDAPDAIKTSVGQVRELFEAHAPASSAKVAAVPVQPQLASYELSRE